MLPMGPLAYLNSEYPSLSHTFIEREIRALRGFGMGISTFSVRGSAGQGRSGTAHAAAAAETGVLQAGVGVLLRDAAWSLKRSPMGVVRALIASQRLSPPGLMYRFKHAAYVLQGLRLARLMNSAGLHHVHVHMANNGAAIAMMACEFDRGLNYSLSIHGSAEFFHVDSWTLAAKVERAKFVRCISSFCKAQVMAWTSPSCWSRLFIVHCGIDTAVYTPRPPRQPGPLRILAVGRLHPIKGYELLLRACSKLSENGCDWELDLVGDGPQMPSLRATAAQLGILDRVTFSGGVSQDDILHHFERADVLVVSSFMEGVPVVLMEAMSKRLAVVATRVGGIPELVREGVDGVLVDPGSSDSLCSALMPLARDPSVCERFGRSARERIAEQFSMEGLGRHMYDLFVSQLADSMQTPRTQGTPSGGAARPSSQPQAPTGV